MNFDLIVILHGCPPNEQLVTPHADRWMNWLEKELKVRKYNAVAPDFPTPWNPKYEEWKKVFQEYPVTEKTLLIGHSCGGAFLVRWLLEKKMRVKKLILVAPAKVPESDQDARKDLYDFLLPKDASEIADDIVIFTSNDLPHHKQSLDLYIKALKPRFIELENKVHFLFFQMKTNEFPELLQEIVRA